MQEVQKSTIFSDPFEEQMPTNWLSYLPVLFAVGGALLLALIRIQMGGERFIADGALMILALACYVIAAAFQLTNLYAPSPTAQQIGLLTTMLGVFFNLSSWLVRWVSSR